MGKNNFFTEQEEQSLIKATIVKRYFGGWSAIIKATVRQLINPPRLAYIDLFAGPGRYEDGATTTPIMILQTAIADKDLSEMLVTVFNDKDEVHARTLEANVNEISNLGKLRYKPKVLNQEVGTEIVNLFERPDVIPDLFYYDKRRDKNAIVPTLFFVDPWGYKGLSLKLINSVIQHWGSDVIIFFNYNRINMGVGNELVHKHMAALFSEDRAKQLEDAVKSLSPEERELTIIEAITSALREMGVDYVLPFRFRNEQGSRTTHHLIFASKHIKGYNLMKDIMAKESSTETEGVPSFEYSPATERQPYLLEYARPLKELAELLLMEFKGKTMTVIDIYNSHHIGRKFILRNYKDVLMKLELENRVIVYPSKRRKGTLADHCTITFP